MNSSSYLKQLYERTKMKVIAGPFKNMEIVPMANWGSGDIAAKLIGSYENELYPCIEDVIAYKPDKIINIGCAEGFYGVGCAMRLPTASVIFVDIDQKSLDIARANVTKNNIDLAKCTFTTESSVISLQKEIAGAHCPFIFMDCEGAEYELLQPSNELSRAIILVELHPFKIPGESLDSLAKRFVDTHYIRIIKQGAKNPYIPIIDDFPDIVKMNFICENRPCTMYWLYLVPKTMHLNYF